MNKDMHGQGLIPVTFDENLDHFLDLGCADTDSVDTALGRIGRNDGPAFLADLWAYGLLTAETATAVIGSVWSGAEYPDSNLDRDLWRALFDLAGYTVDGECAERPPAHLTLYRGSVTERRADWSWTERLDVAQSYAYGGLRGRPSGVVWTALVEPCRLLCRNTAARPGEWEYVVDTHGLTIEAVR